MGQNIRCLLLITIFVILALGLISDCKKQGKKKHFRLHESHHHRHHHHHHHKHASGKHNKDKHEVKTKEYYDKGEHQKKDEKTDKSLLREQLRKFREKLYSQLQKCKKGGSCPTGTCCWKDKCKILPHRLNQKCSKACPCSDTKESMYCHFKTIGSKSSKYGQCYLKGDDFGLKEVNFIPETIEKLNTVEKKMMKEKVVEEKKLKKRSKKNKKSKKERKNHSKKN